MTFSQMLGFLMVHFLDLSSSLFIISAFNLLTTFLPQNKKAVPFWKCWPTAIEVVAADLNLNYSWTEYECLLPSCLDAVDLLDLTLNFVLVCQRDRQCFFILFSDLPPVLLHWTPNVEWTHFWKNLAWVKYGTQALHSWVMLSVVVCRLLCNCYLNRLFCCSINRFEEWICSTAFSCLNFCDDGLLVVDEPWWSAFNRPRKKLLQCWARFCCSAPVGACISVVDQTWATISLVFIWFADHTKIRPIILSTLSPWMISILRHCWSRVNVWNDWSHCTLPISPPVLADVFFVHPNPVHCRLRSRHTTLL